MQLHAFAGTHRAQHRVGVAHLHTDDLDLGPHRLEVGSHARHQPAPADGDEHRIDRLGVLPEDLHSDRALTGDHLGIVEWVHERQAALLLERQCVGIRIGVTVTVKHDLAAEAAHGIDLDRRRGHRHHDHRAAAQPVRAQRDALRMVAGRRTDHAAPQLRGAQLRHLVVGTAQLETEHRLRVFALEQHAVSQTLRQRGREFEVAFDRDLVDARGQDLLQVFRGRKALRAPACGR